MQLSSHLREPSTSRQPEPNGLQEERTAVPLSPRWIDLCFDRSFYTQVLRTFVSDVCAMLARVSEQLNESKLEAADESFDADAENETEAAGELDARSIGSNADGFENVNFELESVEADTSSPQRLRQRASLSSSQPSAIPQAQTSLNPVSS